MTNLKSTRFAVLTALFIGIFVQAAHADQATLRGEEDTVWASVGTGFFNYKEPSAAPDLPDSEHGWLPSVAAGVTWMLPASTRGFARNMFLSIEGTGEFGNAHYNGAFFVDPTIPLEGTTAETIATVDGKIGKGLPLGSSVMFIPYLEVGYRYWDRDLGGGQVEDYENFNALGGLMFQISPMNRLLLSIYGAAGTTLAPSMTTAGDTYDLGTSGIYKFGGKVGFDITQQWQVFTTLDFDHFQYGQSGVVDSAYEPNSATNDTIWRVGFGYHFH